MQILLRLPKLAVLCLLAALCACGIKGQLTLPVKQTPAPGQVVQPPSATPANQSAP